MNLRKRLAVCHQSVAIDSPISLKVGVCCAGRGSRFGMLLKYLSKLVMDILPSVVATIIGAYIVNHYINNKPAADAPGAAAVSAADPKKAESKAAKTDVKAPEKAPEMG